MGTERQSNNGNSCNEEAAEAKVGVPLWSRLVWINIYVRQGFAFIEMQRAWCRDFQRHAQRLDLLRAGTPLFGQLYGGVPPLLS